MKSHDSTNFVEPIFKVISVQTTPPRAFEVFTAGVSRWWIPNFSINPTKSAIAAVVLEPKVGGRWYERGEDGSECDWGRVLVWEPPTRLVVDWQIDAEARFNPMLHTEVEVCFKTQGSDRTEVTLEHRQLERLGESAATVRARRVDGWKRLLERFVMALSSPSAAADSSQGRAVRVEAFAPTANIQLAVGGAFEIYFNPQDERHSTKGLKILSYAPEEMLSLQWNAPPDMPEVRDGGTWVVVQLCPRDGEQTRVTVTHLGWKEGAAWDRAFQHFTRAWEDLVSRLERRFVTGPINWNTEPMMWTEQEKAQR